MRTAILYLIFFLITPFLFAQSDEENYVNSLLRLDFSSAKQQSVLLDDVEKEPLYFYLQEILNNAGQRPYDDIQIYQEVLDNNDLDVLLKNLILGAFNLYNNPSNEESLGYLSNAIVSAKQTNSKELEKIAYLLILELYEQEIVQSSEDYKKYLDEYGAIVESNYEMAWFHIHNARYIIKSVNVEEAASLFEVAYNNLESHFREYHFSPQLNTYYYFISAIYHRFHLQLDLAKAQYLKTIELSSDSPYLKYVRFSSLLHLCSIESSQKRFEAARKYLVQAKENWNVSDSVRSQFIHDRFSAIYYHSKVGDYDSAYNMLLKSIRGGDNLDYRKNTLKISEMNVKLKTAEKENEILAQKNELAVQQKWLWMITIFSITLTGLSVALVLTFRKIKTKNRKIQTLMRELHHRVKNNLQVVSSLLGLQSMKLQDPVARKAVTEGKDRLRAMSLIHQKLYQDEDKIGLNIKEYLSNLVTELAQSYGYQNKTKFILDIPSVELDADNALPLGLIVNELVSNSFKYAFEGINNPELEIKLFQENKNEFSFLYRDNGPGFPDGFDMASANSFGTKLVSILVKQLNGTMEVDQKNGLMYRINFRFR